MKIGEKIILVLITIIVLSCVDSNSSKKMSLKDNFKDYYMIGVAINQGQILDKKETELNLVQKEFNTITPENMLKWEKVHPAPDEFYFEASDSMVAFAERNDIFIVGHTLVWHSQCPDWVFEDSDGNELTRDQLLARLENHIHTVVGRYKGRIQAWDVVNEAILDDGSFRETKWYKIIGEDFIEKAFEYANEADPRAELYYNDYNMWHPGKVETVVKLVNSLKEKGIKVDGIGLQGHWGLEYPSNEEIENALKKYSQLNVQLMITELDMAVLPHPENNTSAEISKSYELMEKYNPYPDGLPDSMQIKLSERYVDFFTIFNKYKSIISRVTFWGLHDGSSWKNNWPIKGRTEYPLLFDRQLNPKPAYFEVIKTVEK